MTQGKQALNRSRGKKDKTSAHRMKKTMLAKHRQGGKAAHMPKNQMAQLSLKMQKKQAAQHDQLIIEDITTRMSTKEAGTLKFVAGKGIGVSEMKKQMKGPKGKTMSKARQRKIKKEAKLKRLATQK
eukprot:TRINITY_DN12921_c0_g1_i1.p3 TRINITY_DN12921_c0_g1~~TRINITY_DN12921_c0_g1_i1.p3  ORF type:complete len:127 (+),score=18.61 TRINITY_DN12921_c0_g1_i1:54-434(+)